MLSRPSGNPGPARHAPGHSRHPQGGALARARQRPDDGDLLRADPQQSWRPSRPSSHPRCGAADSGRRTSCWRYCSRGATERTITQFSACGGAAGGRHYAVETQWRGEIRVWSSSWSPTNSLLAGIQLDHSLTVDFDPRGALTPMSAFPVDRVKGHRVSILATLERSVGLHVVPQTAAV